jgi:dihydroorotase-like cyclic amidohydrolase
MAKFVLTSRHVVIPGRVVPVWAFITIQGEIILDVTEIPPEVDYYEAMEYLDLNVVICNFEDEYISPGLIDLNFKFNGDWEGYSFGTKAALSGGTTFILENPSIFDHQTDDTELVFWDVGSLAIVDA